MKLFVTLAALAAPLFLSLGGCVYSAADYDPYDRHAYIYPDRYQRDYYRHRQPPVVVVPQQRHYVAPAPRHIPSHDHVIVRPDGRRIYVQDRY
jgi:hypothetical protein